MLNLRTWLRPTLAQPRAAALGLAMGLGLALGAGRAGAEPADRPQAKVAMAGAARDTLPFGWRDVYPVAIAQLEADDWTVQRADTTTRRVVTRWKQLKHPLVRIFLGSVLARCVVDVTPLADGRTQLTIQAGLASDAEVEGNPGYAAANVVYKSAAERWLGRVLAALNTSAKSGLVVRVEPAAPLVRSL